MTAPHAKTETPESILADAEADLAAREAEYAALADKITGLRDAPNLHRLSDGDRERVAPVALRRAEPFYSLPERRRLEMLAEAEELEPTLRDSLVACRSRVARLREGARGRRALALRQEYLSAAERIGKILRELNAAVLAERDVSNRVRQTGVLVSPLPDLSFDLMGTIDDTNSPMAGWFRRAKRAGLEK